MEKQNLIELFKHEDTIVLAIEINKVHRLLPAIYELSTDESKTKNYNSCIYILYRELYGDTTIPNIGRFRHCEEIARCMGYDYHTYLF